jgi:hypothetical protein
MNDAAGRAEVAARLRQAGYELPAEAVADIARGHALLAAMLARIAPQPPAAEPATVFRPETAR